MPSRHRGQHEQRGRRADPLGRVLRRVARDRATRAEVSSRPTVASLDVRLEALEQDLREVRTRINALFFAVLTAALGELAGRLVL